MKRIILVLSIATLFVACNKTESTDKKANLAALKIEQAAISSKILKLEAEIAKENPGDGQKIHFVEITALVKESFIHYVEVQGVVESEQNVNVLPRAMGPVTKVLVEPGASVKKGQLLATIDDVLIRKNIDELQNRLDLAVIVFNKQKNLWDQKIGTEIQFLQAKNNKEALERTMSTVNEQLDMTQIKSPINGTVDVVELKVGEMASNMKPAFRIVNLQQLKATAELAESYINTVSSGKEATVVFPDIQKEVSSKVSFVGRVINPVSRTFSVDVKLNSNNDFRPNMIAILKIADYKSLNALSVPMSIIQNDQNNKFIMVAEEVNGKMVAKKKSISTGLIYNGKVEVLSGLTAGEQIITIGFQDLVEGDLIKL